jgi:hypothetical protein
MFCVVGQDIAARSKCTPTDAGFLEFINNCGGLSSVGEIAIVCRPLQLVNSANVFRVQANTSRAAISSVLYREPAMLALHNGHLLSVLKHSSVGRSLFLQSPPTDR